VAVILIWALTGPVFHFSDTWQLVINTATTIVTFLMVFLIQNTQNRDSRALHLKLDEILRALKRARTELVDLKDMPDDELDRLQAQFMELRQELAQRGRNRNGGTDEVKAKGSSRTGGRKKTAGASPGGNRPAD